MRRIIGLMVIAAVLTGCSIPGKINEEIIELTRDKTPYNTGPAVIGIMLATPPLNTLLVSSCKDELFMDKSRRDLCNLNHRIYGTTPAWERNAAEARLMSYQPGELQCSRTLGGVADCRIISGTPRPVTLISSPNMGAN